MIKSLNAKALCGILLLLLFAGLCGTTPANAEGFPVGFPGSTWGNIYRASKDFGGSGIQYNIKQGIDLFKLPGDITFNIHGGYNYRRRDLQTTYYNAEGPSYGIELSKSPLAIGYNEYREKLPDLGRISNNKEYYLTGYFTWRRKFVGGDMTYPGGIWFYAYNDRKGINGSGMQGWVNMGADLYTFPGNVVLNAFAEYRYRHRTKNSDYYDAEGPAAGFELQWSYFKLGTGVYRYRAKEPGRYRTLTQTELYLSWYIHWDLKRLK